MYVFPTAVPALAKSCEVFVFWLSYPKEPLQIEQYVSSCQACSWRAEGEQSRLRRHFRPGAVPASVAKSLPESEVTSPGQSAVSFPWCPSLGVLPPAGCVPFGLGENVGRGCGVCGAGECGVPGAQGTVRPRPAACPASHPQPRPPLFQVPPERCRPAPAPWTSSSSSSRITC